MRNDLSSIRPRTRLVNRDFLPKPPDRRLRLKWILALIVIGLASLFAAGLFDLFFVLFPERIPPFIQVMSLRGPWGEQISTYNGILRHHRYSFALKETRNEIRRHPEFPDHDIETRRVPSLDLWVRDSQPSPPFDAVAFGDSFTFGYGVREDQTFVALLERMNGLNILNTGIPSLSSGQVLDMISRDFGWVKAGAYIYFLYANDISDEVGIKRARSDVTKALPMPNPTPKETALPWPKGLTSKLSRWSVSYELLKQLLNVGDYKTYTSTSLFYNTRGGKLLLKPQFLTTADHDFSSAHAEGVQIVEDDLKEMQRTAARQHRDFFVVYVPSREQVYYTEDFDKKLPPQEGHAPAELVTHAQAELKEFCDQKGITFFDLTPELQERRDTQPLYFNYDRHLSVAGHLAVAQILQPKIRRWVGGRAE
jgi:lysophospholipase L1-like esterase